MDITLMRHGETYWNQQGRIQGSKVVSISVDGIRQVTEACNYFKKSPNFDFSLIVTSPSLRALQSAAICCRELNIPTKVMKNFKERHFGFFETLTMVEIQSRFGITNFEELEDGPNYNIESIFLLDERLRMGVNILKTIYRSERILLITHGSIIKRMAAWNDLHLGIIQNGGHIQMGI